MIQVLHITLSELVKKTIKAHVSYSQDLSKKIHNAKFILLLTIKKGVQLYNLTFSQSKELTLVHLNSHFYPRSPLFLDRCQLKLAPKERWHLNHVVLTLGFSDISLKKKKSSKGKHNHNLQQNEMFLLFQELQVLEKNSI